jgi:hypothetical protein
MKNSTVPRQCSKYTMGIFNEIRMRIFTNKFNCFNISGVSILEMFWVLISASNIPIFIMFLLLQWVYNTSTELVLYYYFSIKQTFICIYSPLFSIKQTFICIYSPLFCIKQTFICIYSPLFSIKQTFICIYSPLFSIKQTFICIYSPLFSIIKYNFQLFSLFSNEQEIFLKHLKNDI